MGESGESGDSVEDAVRPRDATASLFYRSVRPLDPSGDADLALGGDSGYRFAAASNVVPLNAVEFREACRHYPIVFNTDAAAEPLALVGIGDNRNLFVEADAAWAEGCYIPAFLRRYPFLLVRRAADSIELCVDPDSELLTTAGPRALFADGKPTALTRKIAEFCAAFAREQARTRRLCEVLLEHELLVERAIDIRHRDGGRIAFRGVRTVDETRLRALPQDAVSVLWRAGWLAAIQHHLASLGNFGRLMYRARRRDGTAPGQR